MYHPTASQRGSVPLFRLLGDEPALLTDLLPTIFLDDRPPIGDGRIELLRHRREQR